MSALRASLLLTTTLGLALPAAAQDATQDTTDLGEISISASSQPVRLSETGASVTVVTADDLQDGGSISLAQQLSAVPGVAFSSNGGLGEQTTLRLRGLGSQYIGVRLDGIDITDPSGTQTGYDFGATMIDTLSRIEVLRGSQSALYGANAVGGVIDMTTWRPTQDGASGEASAEGGSNGTWSGALSAGVKGSQGVFALSASRTITNGISAAASGTEDDAFQTSKVSAYGRYDVTGTFSIGANGFWQQSHADMDGSAYDASTKSYVPVDSADTADSTLRGGRVFSDFSIGDTTHELSVARTQTQRDYYYADYGSSYDYKGTRTTLEYAGHWAMSQAVAFDWGASRAKEQSEGTGAATTNSVFGEALLKPTDDLDISLALRNDVHSLFGAKPTGRAAVAWHATPDWTIRGVASTGYRAPSVYELYSDYGNKDLTPETSQTFELGAEYAFDGGSVQATLFHTRIKDRILFDNDSMSCASAQMWSYPGCYAQVAGNTTVQGVELTGKYDLAPGWTLNGNYTYTDAMQDAASGGTERAELVPRHMLNLGLDGLVAPRWHLGGSVQYVADFVDDGKMPDYTLANVQLAYDVSDKAQAYVRINNLFDKTYQTIRGYGEPGRQLFIGLRAKF